MRCEPTGPKDAKIALVGEAPGKSEELLGMPFIGESGQLLTQLLADAGIIRSECYLTNVFMDRPPSNNFNNFCSKKKEVSIAYKELRPELIEKYPNFPWPLIYTWERVAQGKYVNPDKLYELVRLRNELLALKPNLVIALGAKALWALTGDAAITKHRGAIAESSLVPGQKILPTFHPAYIMRNWSGRPFLLADLMKAKGEQDFPEIIRMSRLIYIRPSISDMWDFFNEYIKSASEYLSYDIETLGGQITCISFAPSIDRALTVPFLDRTKDNWSYWKTAKEEIKAIRFVGTCLAHGLEKVTQNGIYDMQYCWRVYGLPVAKAFQDTMLLHHALMTESPKDLGTLGSIYTNEAAWKIMRKRSKDRAAKREE